MGRFDALTQLEENQEPAKPPRRQSVAAPSPEVMPPAEKPQRATSEQPAGQSRNAEQPKQEKFEKYSTYLRPGYKKELKSIALERDCKDYEVLDEALTLFFESRKK